MASALIAAPEPRSRDATSVVTDQGIRWARVAIAAVLLEVALVLVLLPIGIVFGEPFLPGSSKTGRYTIFFTAVPVGCFVFGYIAGMSVVRPLASRFLVHGALTGIFATAIYLALSALQPGSIQTVAAGYGHALFYATQVLRIAGCAMGAFVHGKRAPQPFWGAFASRLLSVRCGEKETVEYTGTSRDEGSNATLVASAAPSQLGTGADDGWCDDNAVR